MDAQALNTAIEDEIFDPDEIDYNLTDNHDTEGNDASFFAACAYANAAIWQIKSGKSDATKCQEFWEWWLTQAVPAAWEAVREQQKFVKL